ncbi:Aminopeptidase N [Rhodobacteraceae bacterium THAF1]|uniref:aminopeptidase N n=1 Tax=Palleronia sp. THAF1 TaxID=2587842 RepID=UPI000F3E13D9|nr:aminopeptidase N [Palleronia sp. THAF1]QFU09245.1 Aminopeptidase N [Palleronia sp. THAF1]VDC27371.1 Aminopeptidase N [Rhodobacteraceae bacterium THAF1]
MKDAAPRTIRLSEYSPPAYLVDDVQLTFRLIPLATRVLSRISFRRNPDGDGGPLRLDGEGLKLISARIDGAEVQPKLLTDGLEIDAPDTFVWEAEVEIAPQENTALSGLYMSNGMYCTQCEAEGFRRITYYPDRPDVMAPFTVRIESDRPVLLSNGDPVEQGDGYAVWQDPWKKPAYLFALVAGDLVAHSDHFTTSDFREVTLNIWVRPGDEDRCAYAMDSLIRSMAWDEEHYGRAYDLDVFNIVAVDDFNMGAMENKGLNIFNARYVLASSDTATDTDYARIEAIIAHEYFHNWTGNRVTCRDWFQLCLKEGLTVFRDQQFSGDERSHAVKRIEDVTLLRARQFREDAGPLAHPVRPQSYIEINNFYTATVYEKGAEVVGMLRTLIGPDAYRKALDLYFERHDGQACTIEDWLTVFHDATGRDLTQFALWYEQAGTPTVTVDSRVEDGELLLDLTQSIPATPGQPDKAPQVIPLTVGAIARDGTEALKTTLVELTEAQQTVRLPITATDVVPSVNRGFAAPINLQQTLSQADRALLLAHDTDPFNKWDAGRVLARQALIAMVRDGTASDATYLDALAPVIEDDTLDPAFRALVLALPSDDDLAQALAAEGHTPDPMVIDTARSDMARAMAERLEPILAALYDDLRVKGPYSPAAVDAGKRSLRNAALSLLTKIDGGARAQTQFNTADNMTDSVAALSALLRNGFGEDAANTFYDRWQNDRLVMDKWFSLQVMTAPGETGVATAARLTEHPAFDWKNPNRFRSVFGALGGNHASFHAADGSGYDLLADWLIRLDPLNPQTTARMTTMFETWPRYDDDRQRKAQAALRRIAATEGLSRDTAEMLARMLD